MESHATYVQWLQEENAAFLAAVRLGLDAAVPSCPGWTVRDLALHHGSFQAWITALITQRAQTPTAPQPVDPGDADVPAWYEAIGDRLVAVLSATAPDEPVWDVTGQHRAGAWARRQAAETAVHRWDAQHAHGGARPVAHAADYLDEIVSLLIGHLVAAFGAPAPVGTLRLVSRDDRRHWSVGWVAGLVRQHDSSTVDVHLDGTSSDLLLALWRRPSDALVEGDRSVLESWSAALAGS